ncbi:hypothetical protein M9H77_15766 [Catharanthus roseus]|uniref:Uncharacterized protein n=1 Tax=Catharanthus roseus TaxID=4058 RepID=A0ACC0B0L8_CATRO|nr:hypothetical protein M9H77_15766 [Catharanthus roseus]
MVNEERSRKAAKRIVVAISSSSEEEEESFLESDDDNVSSESESEDDYNISGDSDDDVVEITSSPSCDYEYSDDCVDEENEGKDEESLYRRVVNLLRGKSDLQELTLVECKAYLRKHGLRLSGTKTECILRIKEHWKLKDGTGETLYPRSSFNINCTGDVCRGDVVLFTQKVYKKFDKVARSGRVLGKRTVAGRIVKESYGAAKQQHTFTVEVLWSKGAKKLPPLFPLLVKGRNLYRMKTYRWPWKNEKERAEVLVEKHTRGAAARLVREMRRTKAVKRMQNGSCTNEGTQKQGSRHQKHFHQHLSSSQTSKAVKKDKHGDRHGKAPVVHQKRNYSHRDVPAFGRSNLEGIRKLNPFSSHQQHQNFWHPFEDEEFVNRDYCQHYGQPIHEWRNFNDFSSMRTNRTPHPFSYGYKTESSRHRK